MLLVITLILFLVNQISACEQRAYPSGFVCVCTAEGCDNAPQVGQLSESDIKVVYTSPAYPGFTATDASFGSDRDAFATAITVNSQQTFQKIIGFGGAITDAVGINVLKLSGDLQNKLLNSFFSDDGIEYNMIRVPLGACDFSPRLYTLDDNEGDVNLEKFALQYEDLNYKIPVIQRAMALRGNKQLNLITSAWTAAPWMKDKPVWSTGSQLKPEYYQTWANYHVKFFDEYAKSNIKFWGLTTGNGPLTGFMKWTAIPSMGWTTSDQARYIKENLGPAIRNSNHSNLKIMIHDEAQNVLPFMVPPILDDDEALQYVDGVAMHWYQDGNFDVRMRELAFSSKKDTFVLETETCHVGAPPDLGSWTHAVEYIDNIMTDLEYGYAGWMEWNLALDSGGGPTQINFVADAPIILSEDFSEFYKQPTFYIIGHFSKYVIPGSLRISAQTTENLRVLAFLRPDNIKVLSVYNAANNVESIQINDGERYSSVIYVPAQSINTIMYLA